MARSSKRDNEPPQSEKFAEAARKLGADESEQHFDEALKRVGTAKLTHPPRPKKEDEKDDPAK